MVQRLTNKKLSQLLTNLGFEQGQVNEKSYRTWRHPESGCTLALPANKTDESPRPADLVGIKAQLDQQGHLDEAAFDEFVAEGKLGIPSEYP
jgi:hypothetical protein